MSDQLLLPAPEPPKQWKGEYLTREQAICEQIKRLAEDAGFSDLIWPGTTSKAEATSKVNNAQPIWTESIPTYPGRGPLPSFILTKTRFGSTKAALNLTLTWNPTSCLGKTVDTP